ncbi:hypothetical protein SeLEV6574_g00531 [Synchytrium endobioticum]|nr:hypothetical protein SeLEV6574_g00531 [Synchytrium endobioticum]
MEGEIKQLKRVYKSLVNHPMSALHPPPNLRNAADKLFHSLPLPIFVVRCLLATGISVTTSILSHLVDGGLKDSWTLPTTICHSIAQAVMNHHPPQGRHSLDLVKFATSFTYPIMSSNVKIQETDLLIDNAEVLRMVVSNVATTMTSNSNGGIRDCSSKPSHSQNRPSRRGSDVVQRETRTLKGEWINACADGNPHDRNKTILYFHGGAHLFLSPRTHRGITSRLSASTGCKLFALDFRLADSHPFPAAIEDAVAAYCALIGWTDHGFHAHLKDFMGSHNDEERGLPSPHFHKDIVFAGDSSGGALCLQLLLVCRELGIPLPAGAILMSPLADCECQADSYHRNRYSDILSLDQDGMKWAMKIYSGHYSTKNPLVSPINAFLDGLPPILIQCGDSELLTDDAVSLYNSVNEAGGKVKLEIAYERMDRFMAQLDNCDEWMLNQHVEISPCGKPTVPVNGNECSGRVKSGEGSKSASDKGSSGPDSGCEEA